VGLATGAFGQSQTFFTGSNVTGQLVFTTTVNLMKQAQLAQTSQAAASVVFPHCLHEGRVDCAMDPRNLSTISAEFPMALQRRLAPRAGINSPEGLARSFESHAQTPDPVPQSLTVGTSSSFGFRSLTHLDQRNANNGNQFSVEPPSEGLAVSNGFVVQGVNNAIQVYTTAGVALLPAVLSTNQVFGLSPALNRTTGVFGVFPTDIRVFYDQTMDRWLIAQRDQDTDVFGNPLASSHLYLAVSQTNDPTGTYNIYVMNTTDAGNFGCPCIADYPQIGADQYGLYVSYNEFNSGLFFNDAAILAISKASLKAGVLMPTMVQFIIPMITGYEFAIQPATTPVGASYFIADGGVQYFTSSQASFSFDSNLAIWAMTNTSSLGIGNPSLTLIETTVPTLSYFAPNPVRQRPGPTPYGTSLGRPLEFLDGGDLRLQSTTYAGGHLWATLETLVADPQGNFVTAIAYIIFSPSFRSATISAPVVRQGTVFVTGNHLLRPALAVNPQGNGAMVCTLVGPDYFPSAAFVTINLTSTDSTLQVAGAGFSPEDGFSGYSGSGLARWGDYSAAVADANGSIWMATEYIPNSPRTPLANWGTFITKVTP
jgi:hypothetical protein